MVTRQPVRSGCSADRSADRVYPLCVERLVLSHPKACVLRRIRVSGERTPQGIAKFESLQRRFNRRNRRNRSERSECATGTGTVVAAGVSGDEKQSPQPTVSGGVAAPMSAVSTQVAANAEPEPAQKAVKQHDASAATTGPVATPSVVVSKATDTAGLNAQPVASSGQKQSVPPLSPNADSGAVGAGVAATESLASSDKPNATAAANPSGDARSASATSEDDGFELVSTPVCLISECAVAFHRF